MAELLLELYSEEVPSRMQKPALEQLEASLTKKLTEEDIPFGKVQSFVTPHRLVLVINDIPETKAARKEERRGPRADAPEKAIEGFCRSAGLKKEDLVTRKTDKGEFYFAVIETAAQETAATLQSAIESTLQNFTWPKSMRWGEYNIRWVRPLHHIVCLFNGQVLPVSFGHIAAGDTSKGHRFMAPETFKVKDADDYKKKLKAAKVVLSHEERKDIIHTQITKLAKDRQLAIKEDPGLLDEVTGLVEYPVALLGEIDQKFLSVPQEALISSMRSHQKYFSLLDHSDKIAPYFITIANIDTKDNGQKITHGNQRVLSARLEDAKFFWDQDRQKKLEDLLPQLQKIVFHEKLGTVANKVERITALAKLYAVWIPHANLIKTERAAELCKTDLVTEMVGEFPELQGLMGFYYANDNKEDPEVALAIKEHYSPLGPKDNCPQTPVSIAVALADKVDTLAGLFAAGDKPTGSKDPYALRRAALGVIRIILENELRIPLDLMFEKAIARYPKTLLKDKKGLLLKKKKTEKPKEKEQRILTELKEFFIDRLRIVLKEQESIRYDVVNAVLSSGSDDDLVLIVKRAKALNELLQTDDGHNLLAAYKRAVSIVSAEEKKDGVSYQKEPDKSLIKEAQEVALFDAYNDVLPHVETLLKEEDFTNTMQQLASLRKPIDQFFEHITVNSSDNEERKNRLALLASFTALVNSVADLQKIEG